MVEFQRVWWLFVVEGKFDFQRRWWLFVVEEKFGGLRLLQIVFEFVGRIF